MSPFRYCHPTLDNDGKPMSTANIIWSACDRGSSSYRVSRYAMKGGKFPADHPCAPFDDDEPIGSAQLGGSKQLTAFRARGYWASCFPEGDGITLRWWGDDASQFPKKSAEEVIRDIYECFGWKMTR